MRSKILFSNFIKYKRPFQFLILILLVGFSLSSHAAEEVKSSKKTRLDFEGVYIEGEIRSPKEFYFERKPEEKMNSLVKRRKNFHRQILRDVVLSQ